MSMFAKATKKKARLRLAIAGASGSGKTFTALTVGKYIGRKMALIDTERGSASKYAGDVADFDACELDHFAVQRYLQAIKSAAESGYDVLVIDSLSHAWAGKGGILEEADKRGGKFGAWRDLTPIQQSLMDAILSYPGHVIATMRSKMAYEVTTDESKGRKETKVEKIGLAHVQRDDVSYEFDVMLDMDEKNNARVTKTRCQALAGLVLTKPGKDLADTLLAWLDQGEAAPERPLAATSGPSSTSTEGTATPRTKPAQTTEAVAQTGGGRPLAATATQPGSTPMASGAEHTRPNSSRTSSVSSTSITASSKTMTGETSREPTAPNLDGYGIAIPLSMCPIVPAGKQNAGKPWDQLPRWLLEKMRTEHRDRMNAVQREWIDYLVAHHGARKAAEATALAKAAEAGFVPDDGEAPPHAEAGCGADPADGEAAQ